MRAWSTCRSSSIYCQRDVMQKVEISRRAGAASARRTLLNTHHNYDRYATMGCTSSTEQVVDPHTGQVKQKKKLGGQYPGQRRAQNAPYMPPDEDFHADNVVDYSADKVAGVTRTATAHFVAYGGGNALMLMDKPNRAAQRVDDPYSVPEKEFIEVTLPANVNPGDVIHVKNPKGQTNAIVVPAGMGPGSTFTVEFDSGDAPPPEEEIAVAVAEPSSAASQYPDAPVYPTSTQPYAR